MLMHIRTQTMAGYKTFDSNDESRIFWTPTIESGGGSKSIKTRQNINFLFIQVPHLKYSNLYLALLRM